MRKRGSGEVTLIDGIAGPGQTRSRVGLTFRQLQKQPLQEFFHPAFLKLLDHFFDFGFVFFFRN